MHAKEWLIISKSYKQGLVISCEVGEGENSHQDGPERIIGTFISVDDADHICNLHNATLDEKEGK